MTNRKPARHKTVSLCILTLAFVSVTTAAHAYIDPGTGSTIVQGLLAVIAGAAIGLNFYWNKVKGFFRNLMERKTR